MWFFTYMAVTTVFSIKLAKQFTIWQGVHDLTVQKLALLSWLKNAGNKTNFLKATSTQDKSWPAGPGVDDGHRPYRVTFGCQVAACFLNKTELRKKRTKKQVQLYSQSTAISSYFLSRNAQL